MSLITENTSFTAEISPEILFQQLQQLVQQIIIPDTESLIPALITRLEERLEVIDDEDIGSWVDFKKLLNDAQKGIVDRFNTALTQDRVEHNADDLGSVTLELMDNEDLDQKLLWLNAAGHAGAVVRKLFHSHSSTESRQKHCPATVYLVCRSFQAGCR